MKRFHIPFKIKIFEIEKSHYELKHKRTSKEIIETIINNHKLYNHSKKHDLNVVKPTINESENGDLLFFSYCFNEPKELKYWELFLPQELTKNHNLEITEFSFVLFIEYRESIYCVIGGSGMSVIKKYINPFFGIDFYQHFADPNSDIVLYTSTRGVAGNYSERTNTYSYNQTVNLSIDYVEIPKKMKIIIRNELLDTVFKDYDLNKTKPIMEIGSYFSLNKRLTFEKLKTLIVDIHKIREDKSRYCPITFFSKVNDIDLIYKLDEHLQYNIVNDVKIHNTPDQLNFLNNNVVEIINKNNIAKYLECDKYKIKFKRQRADKLVEINNKEDLYFECTKHIYNSVHDLDNDYDIKGKLFELNIIGEIDNKESTFGNFYSHITAEIEHHNKKYFRIDSYWFCLEDKFIEKLNHDAKSYYLSYELPNGILNKWHDGIDEEKYNKSHKSENHYVFDRITKDNIELCDIFYLNSDKAYFIHVKDGFDTRMRTLSNQIILSAKRLWSDLNNVSGSQYFAQSIAQYNKCNSDKHLNEYELIKKFNDRELKIVFVMAFHNQHKGIKKRKAIEKIEASKSNIAKFSIVQTVFEMKNYKDFEFKIIDIADI